MGQALDSMGGYGTFLSQVSQAGLLLLLFSGNWTFKLESIQDMHGPLLHSCSESRGKLLETSNPPPPEVLKACETGAGPPLPSCGHLGSKYTWL